MLGTLSISGSVAETILAILFELFHCLLGVRESIVDEACGGVKPRSALLATLTYAIAGFACTSFMNLRRWSHEENALALSMGGHITIYWHCIGLRYYSTQDRGAQRFADNGDFLPLPIRTAEHFFESSNLAHWHLLGSRNMSDGASLTRSINAHRHTFFAPAGKIQGKQLQESPQ